jgi:hypothetical protein
MDQNEVTKEQNSQQGKSLSAYQIPLKDLKSSLLDSHEPEELVAWIIQRICASLMCCVTFHNSSIFNLVSNPEAGEPPTILVLDSRVC